VGACKAAPVAHAATVVPKRKKLQPGGPRVCLPSRACDRSRWPCAALTGVSEDHKLALVAGVSHNFLVAGDGGVEDDLGDLRAAGAKPNAVPDRAILQDQPRVLLLERRPGSGCPDHQQPATGDRSLLPHPSADREAAASCASTVYGCAAARVHSALPPGAWGPRGPHHRASRAHRARCCLLQHGGDCYNVRPSGRVLPISKESWHRRESTVSAHVTRAFSPTLLMCGLLRVQKIVFLALRRSYQHRQNRQGMCSAAGCMPPTAVGRRLHRPAAAGQGAQGVHNQVHVDKEELVSYDSISRVGSAGGCGWFDCKSKCCSSGIMPGQPQGC
jgi:hypothetical protein